MFNFKQGFLTWDALSYIQVTYRYISSSDPAKYYQDILSILYVTALYIYVYSVYAQMIVIPPARRGSQAHRGLAKDKTWAIPLSGKKCRSRSIRQSLR